MRDIDDGDWLARGLDTLRAGWRGRLRLSAPDESDTGTDGEHRRSEPVVFGSARRRARFQREGAMAAVGERAKLAAADRSDRRH